MTSPAGTRAVRTARTVAGCAVLVVLGLLVQGAVVTAAWLLPAQRGVPDPATGGRGLDAVWLGHAWVDGRHGEADVEALASRLRGGRFADVFVHTGPLADDGSLDPARAPRLTWLAGRLHTLVPGLRVQAWLGDVVGPDRLDLADPATRARVVAAAGRSLDAGADGVHYDLEPLPDGDPGYLALLAATRAVTSARGAVLSVAAEPVEPFPGAARTTTWARPLWWTPDYLRRVAGLVDTVALMTYDSTLPSQRLYTGLVVRQVRSALAVVPPGTTLLVGLPAYHGGTLEHRPGAETVPAALRAARLAAPPPGRRYGVALYADFAATEADWQAQREWARAAPGAPS